MLSIVTFLFVLSILVVIHEFGHFVAAKRQGVRVEKFSLGFGPKVFGLKKGDTEYMICAVPLGGYVKMAGDEAVGAKGAPDEFLSKSVGQRFKIVFMGPLLNYFLGFLLFWLVFFIGAPTVINKVGAVLDDYPAKAAGVKQGDLIVEINGNPTRYMTLNRAVELIKKSKGDTVSLVFQKDMVIWGKQGG